MEPRTKKLLEHRTIIKKRKPNFLRKDTHEVSRLGSSRRKKQKWRKPKGRHNKLRAKIRNVGVHPSVGYRSPKSVRGSIAGLKPVLVKNEKDIGKIKEGEIAVLASLGLKKKIQIAKKVSNLPLKFLNFDANKFLAEIQKKTDERKKPEQEKKAEEK